MIRKLKAFGLALVAVFAMSVIAASGASAQTGTLVGTESPFTLTGKEKEGGENFLEIFGLKTKCPQTLYTGHRVLTHAETTAGKTHERLQNGDSKVTITPHYKGCTTAGFPMTIDMNGCDYDFNLGKTTGVADQYSLTTTVTCPSTTNTPVFTIFTEAAHTNKFCEVEVTVNAKEANQEYEGLTATDETNGHIRIKGEIKNLPAHKRVGPDASLFCSKAETTEAARLVVDVTVDADNALGETIGVGIDHA